LNNYINTKFSFYTYFIREYNIKLSFLLIDVYCGYMFH